MPGCLKNTTMADSELKTIEPWVDYITSTKK